MCIYVYFAILTPCIWARDHRSIQVDWDDSLHLSHNQDLSDDEEEAGAQWHES